MIGAKEPCTATSLSRYDITLAGLLRPAAANPTAKIVRTSFPASSANLYSYGLYSSCLYSYGLYSCGTALPASSANLAYAHVRACTCACACACVRACVRACVGPRVHACVQACKRVHKLACVRVGMRVHVGMRACVCACGHACMRVCMWACQPGAKVGSKSRFPAAHICVHTYVCV